MRMSESVLKMQRSRLLEKRIWYWRLTWNFIAYCRALGRSAYIVRTSVKLTSKIDGELWNFFDGTDFSPGEKYTKFHHLKAVE